jgi:hypothetical protein
LFETSRDRCDSPFRYSFSISGQARSRMNARQRVGGSTVRGAAFRTLPGIWKDGDSLE